MKEREELKIKLMIKTILTNIETWPIFIGNYRIATIDLFRQIKREVTDKLLALIFCY